MDIRIEKTTNPKQKPADETKLGFGHIFTDHMFIMDYDAGQGWHDARIVPYGPIELMPSAMVLHYGQEIFEGMKAYRTPSGDIQFFRPEENFKRMNVSAERLVIPQINEKDAEVKGLTSSIASTQQENDRLQSSIDALDTPEGLEQVARDQLGMVSEGEIVFEDVGDS